MAEVTREEEEIDACLVLENPKRSGSDRYRLQTMRESFVQDLEIVEIELLLDLVISKDLIDSEEKNRVVYEPVPENKMRKLLDVLETKADLLPRGGGRGEQPPLLDILVGFLRDTCDNEGLAQRLIEADGIPQGHREADQTLKIAEGMELTDKILGGVIRHIGPTWESIALELEVANNKIETIKSDTRDPYQKKFKVFNAWRQKSGYKPGSLVVLLRAFRDNFDQCFVDWPGVSRYLQSNKDA